MAVKTKKPKGSVLVQTSKGVFPFSTLQKAESTTTSKQTQGRDKYMTIKDLVPYPYPPESFLLLYESNSTFWACANQIAKDVAGLGWKLLLKEGKSENTEELNRLSEFLNRPNPEESLRNIFKNLLIDYNTIGWFGIEVVRNNSGEISEIYDVPAHTFKIHKTKDKFCQTRNTKNVWFKRFGYEKNISAKDGKDGTFNIKTRANELIYFKNTYRRSTYYGIPNVIAAIGDVIGLIGARDYNLAFFENYGIPSAIIVLEGGWDKGSDRTVMNFLNKEIKVPAVPNPSIATEMTIYAK